MNTVVNGPVESIDQASVELFDMPVRVVRSPPEIHSDRRQIPEQKNDGGATGLSLRLTRRITWSSIGGPTVPAVADFENVRPRLFGIAYRIVGRAADAEDVVQDVWVRWQTADRARVRCPIAFLVTITRRLALNAATSAFTRREVCAGGEISDFDGTGDDPAREAERGQEIEAAVRLLTERLSPVECAVYVLREAFGYPFGEIAETLELSEANARQLACRARTHLREKRHNPVDPAERDGLLRAFLDAARAGDMGRLIDLLSRCRHLVIWPQRDERGNKACSSTAVSLLC